MQFDAVSTRISSPSPTIPAIVDADGSASHPAWRSLTRGVQHGRDLADAVHLICMLHGDHPGVLDRAAQHPHAPDAARWLEEACEGFAIERGRIAHIVALAGPVPSTPGQAETHAVVQAQRHALDMLGASDRRGCALGAAIALALDWTAIGTLLDHAAELLGETPTGSPFPDRAATLRLCAEALPEPAVDRAMLFGAQQLIAQHRGLWDLIEARAAARDQH